MTWKLPRPFANRIQLIVLAALTYSSIQNSQFTLAQQQSSQVHPSGEVSTSATSTMFSGTLRQKNLAALHDPFLPGAMPAYYKPRPEGSRQIPPGLASGEMAFYASELTLILPPSPWQY
jgi:hypothetical protein